MCKCVRCIVKSEHTLSLSLSLSLSRQLPVSVVQICDGDREGDSEENSLPTAANPDRTTALR